MSFKYLFLSICSIYFSYGQINYSVPDSLIDLKYREDQFYMGANYVVIKGENQLVQQNDFSSQVHFGILRDIPLNKKGNFSFAFGVGPSYTQFQSNIDFKTGLLTANKFNTAKYISLNLPFEIRMRSSTSTSFKFWRLYLGSQLQYNFLSKDLDALKKITTFSTINIGYNTWNFSLGYDLGGRLINLEGNKDSQFKLMTVGLIFYIF